MLLKKIWTAAVVAPRWHEKPLGFSAPDKRRLYTELRIKNCGPDLREQLPLLVCVVSEPRAVATGSLANSAQHLTLLRLIRSLPLAVLTLRSYWISASSFR